MKPLILTPHLEISRMIAADAAAVFAYRRLPEVRRFQSFEPRSLALLERVGMRQEAHFRASLWFKGEWVDDVVYAILESSPQD